MKRAHAEITTHEELFLSIPTEVIEKYIVPHIHVPLLSPSKYKSIWYSLISFVSSCKSLYQRRENLIKPAVDIILSKVEEVKQWSVEVYESVHTEYEKEMKMREELRENIKRTREYFTSILFKNGWANFEKEVEKDVKTCPALSSFCPAKLIKFKFAFSSTMKPRKFWKHSPNVTIDVALKPKRLWSRHHPFNYWTYKNNIFNNYMNEDIPKSYLNLVKEGIHSLWFFESQTMSMDDEMWKPLKLKSGEKLTKPYENYKSIMQSLESLRLRKKIENDIEKY
jgi:hypothetical protein